MGKIQRHFKSVFADWKHPFQNQLTKKEKIKCFAWIGGAAIAFPVFPLSPLVAFLGFYETAHYFRKNSQNLDDIDNAVVAQAKNLLQKEVEKSEEEEEASEEPKNEFEEKESAPGQIFKFCNEEDVFQQLTEFDKEKLGSLLYLLARKDFKQIAQQLEDFSLSIKQFISYLSIDYWALFTLLRVYAFEQKQQAFMEGCFDFLTREQREEFLQNYSDVTLEIEDQNEPGNPSYTISSNRMLLSYYSSVFRNLIGDAEPEEEKITITDESPETLKSFIEAIHNGEVVISEENYLLFSALADKYNVPKIGRACVEFVKTHINKNNYRTIVKHASTHGLDKLKKICEEWCASNLEITEDNYKKMLRFARTYKLQGLTDKCDQWIMNHWKDFEKKELSKLAKSYRLACVREKLFLNLLNKDVKSPELKKLGKRLIQLDLTRVKNKRKRVVALEKIVISCQNLEKLTPGTWKDKFIPKISQLKNLQYLDFKAYNITDTDMKTIAELPNLTHLDLSMTQITDEGLKEITKFPNLTYLNLNWTKITDKGVEEIAKLTHLTYLDLSWKSITDKGVKKIAKLPNLVHLDLSRTQITNKGLKKIAKLSKLTYLNLSNISIFTDDGLKEIAKLINLTYLNINNCLQITNKGLKQIAKLPKLMHLKLYYLTEITDKGLEKIAKLHNLTHLVLSFCGNITDKGLEEIAKLHNLTHLKIFENNNITDNGLKTIANLSNLTYLSIGYCPKITNKGLKKLMRLRKLTHLDITGNKKITNEGLKEIAKLPNLLYLSGIKITDKKLKRIKQFIA